MHLASVRPDQLAVARDGFFAMVGSVLAQGGVIPPRASMIDLITRYESLKDLISQAVERATVVEQDPKRLGPPVATPSKIWAAASNYARGGTGLDSAAGRGAATSASPQTIMRCVS